MSEVLLRVQNLSIAIQNGKENLTAVDSISFHINKGEILGIVGESGCGKSLTALSIPGLLQNEIKVLSGNTYFDGRNLLEISKEEKRQINGKEIGIIYQEPMTSLNPLMKIGKQVAEVVILHEKKTKKAVYNDVYEVLKKVGLPDPLKSMDSYPHQLSGGMRQRVMIAMAIICKPKLIIADEPTTALDVTIQTQILELLKEINKEYNTSILFISHDLGVINRICDRVLVMYSGKIIEEGSARTILIHPVHEYTKGLMESIPTREQKGKKLKCIEGRVPSLSEKKYGCPFAPRCGNVRDICILEAPKMQALSMSHQVSCHLADLESEMEYVRI